MANLTENQIKSIIFNAIGRASETATVPFNKLVVSTGNSGYSIGALQTDFGANNAAGIDLIVQYQSWAPIDQRLTDDEIQTAKVVITKKGLDGSHELDDAVEAKLNTFLNSPAGGVWVAASDEVVYQKKLAKIVQPMLDSQIYEGMDNEAAAELVSRISKAFNQNEIIGTRLLKHFKDGELSTTNFNQIFQEELSAPYRGGSLSEASKNALTSGQAHMMDGLKLFNTLISSESEIGLRWRNLISIDPGNLKGLGDDADAIFFDVLFRDPTQGLALAQKLET